MEVKKLRSTKKVPKREEEEEEECDFNDFVFVVVRRRRPSKKGKKQQIVAFIEDKFTTRRHPLQKMRVQMQLRNFTQEGEMVLEIADHVHVSISHAEAVLLAQLIETL